MLIDFQSENGFLIPVLVEFCSKSVGQREKDRRLRLCFVILAGTVQYNLQYAEFTVCGVRGALIILISQLGRFPAETIEFWSTISAGTIIYGTYCRSPYPRDRR